MARAKKNKNNFFFHLNIHKLLRHYFRSLVRFGTPFGSKFFHFFVSNGVFQVKERRLTQKIWKGNLLCRRRRRR
jgi:hypothetical protein